MAKKRTGKQQAAAALKALREIQKARLKVQAGPTSMPHFADLAVSAVVLISDLAADAIRRAKAAK
jgi:hypothetical protein